MPETQDIQDVEELATFFIPVSDSYLLIPNVSVAEVVPALGIYESEAGPDWLLGEVDWRGRRVPLIAFEALNGEAVQARSRWLTIAVLNGISNPAKLPFYAIAAHGAPRLMRLEAEEIIHMTHKPVGAAEHMVVSANGEIAAIPQVFMLEDQILQAQSAEC